MVTRKNAVEQFRNQLEACGVVIDRRALTVNPNRWTITNLEDRAAERARIAEQLVARNISPTVAAMMALRAQGSTLKQVGDNAGDYIITPEAARTKMRRAFKKLRPNT